MTISSLEETLREYAVYSPDSLTLSPIEKIIPIADLQPIASGMQSRVYKIKDKDWIVKEGRWDIELHLNKDIKITVPAKLTQEFLGVFFPTFLPKIGQITKLYRKYLDFSAYFGNFDCETARHDDIFYHPQIAEITARQLSLRTKLADYIPYIEEEYSLTIPKKVRQILSSDIRYHNFLPKEYLLLGRSLHKDHRDKITYFNFQPYIPGPTLHDVHLRDLSQTHRDQLTLFAFLILLTHDHLDLIPDTRPRYPVTQPTKWLTNTDNIIIAKNGLKFVDTRWFWNTKGNFIDRGMFIPEIVINHSKKILTKSI